VLVDVERSLRRGRAITSISQGSVITRPIRRGGKMGILDWIMDRHPKSRKERLREVRAKIVGWEAAWGGATKIAYYKVEEYQALKEQEYLLLDGEKSCT